MTFYGLCISPCTPQLELSDGRVLPCRLVVAADGVNSRVRQLAGLRTWGWGYGQRGLVATVETDGACALACAAISCRDAVAYNHASTSDKFEASSMSSD